MAVPCVASQHEVEEVTDSARHDSGTQTVHLTIAMLIAMASETRQTMLGANRCCLEQIRLRRMCQTANISEVDLTSGEKFPWKQLFKGIPLDKAQKVIGEGITKFTFRLLPEEECFEITCLDETKWLVVADDDEAYNCSTTASDYDGDSVCPKKIVSQKRIQKLHASSVQVNMKYYRSTVSNFHNITAKKKNK